jgi:ADP-ribosylglycohydrolase
MIQENLELDQIDAVTRITSANTTAVEWSRPCAALLSAAYDGAGMTDALQAGIAAAAPEIADALNDAIDTAEQDTVAFAGVAGRACPLPQSLPVMYHIASRAQSFAEAVDRNIRAGGDNCGRAPVLGALFGATHRTGGSGVPLHWVGRLSEVAGLSDEIHQLTRSTH